MINKANYLPTSTSSKFMTVSAMFMSMTDLMMKTNFFVDFLLNNLNCLQCLQYFTVDL